MTTKEAFRLGFLTRMAERGYTPSQFEKRSFSVSGALGVMTPVAIAALLGIPLATGMLTGTGHAELTDVSEDDIARMKKLDVIENYTDEANRVRNKLKRDSWKKRPKREDDSF
jgi:hypothetical protein